MRAILCPVQQPTDGASAVRRLAEWLQNEIDGKGWSRQEAARETGVSAVIWAPSRETTPARAAACLACPRWAGVVFPMIAYLVLYCARCYRMACSEQQAPCGPSGGSRCGPCGFTPRPGYGSRFRRPVGS